MHDEAPNEPQRSLEVENTYDVEDSTPLPAWSLLPGVESVGEPEVRELDARYFDTADMALSQARVAIRRRTGGPDEGWHIKASAAEGKHESHWPLDAQDAESAVVPQSVAAAAGEWATGDFLPLARIRNHRTAYALLDANGGLVAEMVDDRVLARAERTGAETAWREWEVEIGPAGPKDTTEFFAHVDALVASVGGRAAASDSKLGRALGS